jgi:hypothetical protein
MRFCDEGEKIRSKCYLFGVNNNGVQFSGSYITAQATVQDSNLSPLPLLNSVSKTLCYCNYQIIYHRPMEVVWIKMRFQ